MLTEDVNKILNNHLIDMSKITHYKNDGDYWHFFNKDTLTGFELTLEGDEVYTLKVWWTTSFYKDLAMKDAKSLH